VEFRPTKRVRVVGLSIGLETRLRQTVTVMHRQVVAAAIIVKVTTQRFRWQIVHRCVTANDLIVERRLRVEHGRQQVGLRTLLVSVFLCINV
jgi:hypothetical protein